MLKVFNINIFQTTEYLPQQPAVI